jgi:small subunit ribosomal protein S16
MLTARPSDALSSFAGPGSSVRSCRLFPGRRGTAASQQRWEKTTVVAVKIKLKRLGKIREPYYRIVVADARTKRDGRAIEEIGKYHPKAEPSFIQVDSERVQHWLSVGAQPTDPVRVLLKITGDWQKFTGEPGAEGTLRTAEPRADKKEAFTAAAKASQASKEAKEERSSKAGTQSRAAKPAKDTPAKDAPAKDTSAKDTSAKDTSAKDTSAKDTSAKDTSAKDTSAKDTSAKDTPAKDTPEKETSAKDAPAKETTAEETTAEETTAKEDASPAAAEPAAEAKAPAADAETASADVKAAAGESGSGA